MDRFAQVCRSLQKANVRFVVMGVWGINYYAQSATTLFTTADRDLFLSPEPLDSPRDRLFAERIVGFRALTSAIGADGLHVDLSLVMAGFTFDDVWRRRRTFVIDQIEIPVAKLTDIITFKAAAGRDKDRLFLATYQEALEQLQQSDVET